MSTKYYGVKEVPEGKKRANMKEAKEAGQIRYWGAKRADPKLINSTSEKSDQTAQKKKKILALQTAIVKLTGRLKKLTDSLPYAKSEVEKKPILTDISKLQTEVKTKTTELKSLQ